MNGNTLQWPVVLVYSGVGLLFLAVVVWTLVSAIRSRGKK